MWSYPIDHHIDDHTAAGGGGSSSVDASAPPSHAASAVVGSDAPGVATDVAVVAVGCSGGHVSKGVKPAVRGGAVKVFKEGRPAGVQAAAGTSSKKVADGKVDATLKVGVAHSVAADAVVDAVGGVAVNVSKIPVVTLVHDCKHHTKCPPGKCDECACPACGKLNALGGKRERKPLKFDK